MIDISMLQIPPADVVPEPTAAQVVLFNLRLHDFQNGLVLCSGDMAIIASLARRLLSLEADLSNCTCGSVETGRFSPEQCDDFDEMVRLNHRIRELEERLAASLDREQLSAANVGTINRQDAKIRELEAEVERLRSQLLAMHEGNMNRG